LDNLAGPLRPLLIWINASPCRKADACCSLASTGEPAMKSIKMSAAAALVIAAAMIGTASAQNQQNPGGMMGPGMMSPGMMSPGMMGPGMMSPGMTGSGIMGPGMMGDDGSGPGMMRWGPAMCSAMASHLEGRLAYSKAELKITETQESLWNSYAAAARDNTKTMVGHCTAS
jgi:hypothetical protein